MNSERNNSLIDSWEKIYNNATNSYVPIIIGYETRPDSEHKREMLERLYHVLEIMAMYLLKLRKKKPGV